MKSSSGTPPSDPMEGSFKRGGPWRREHRQWVALGGHGLHAVVIGVVRHDGFDEAGEIGRGSVVVGLDGGGGGGELIDEAVEVVEPGGVEAREVESAAHLGTGFP